MDSPSQNDLLTPLKGVSKLEQHRSAPSYGKENWICLNCSNMNFSFRKKCNRCKTQSKKQNDAQTVYSFYYYPNEHLQSSEQKSLKEMSPNQCYFQESFHQKTSAAKPSLHTERYKTPQKVSEKLKRSGSPKDGLPSVSPLLKKYRLRQQQTTLEKNPNQNHQKQWANLKEIRVRDFQDIILVSDFDSTRKDPEINSKVSLHENVEQQLGVQNWSYMDEMEEIISKIVI